MTPAGTYQDPELIDRGDLDLSQLRRHVREQHAHQAARGIPRANRDLASWHAGQHHRFRPDSHIHRGPLVLIKDRDGRRPVGVSPAPLGWFTGQETVSREQVNAEARERIAARRHLRTPDVAGGGDPG
jgi:hypothetical protein